MRIRQRLVNGVVAASVSALLMVGTAGAAAAGTDGGGAGGSGGAGAAGAAGAKVSCTRAADKLADLRREHTRLDARVQRLSTKDTGARGGHRLEKMQQRETRVEHAIATIQSRCGS